MAPLRGKKTALQRLAEEDSKRRKDFDPEDFGDGPASETDSDVSDETANDATSHYEAVGSSKIRKTKSTELGPQYAGSRVSRDALEQWDEESDDGEDKNGNDDGPADNSESDLDGSNDQPDDMESQSASENDEEFDSEDMNDDLDEGESQTDDDISDEGAESNTKTMSKGIAALKAITQQSQGAAVQNLAQAAQADIEKGNAVKKQQAAFNALLDTRMRLQKGFVAANTLATVASADIASDDDREIIEAAERAAVMLFNSISAMRASILATGETEPRGTKRSFSATIDTPSDEIHNHIQSLEQSSTSTRKAILTRWAQKTQSSAAPTKMSKLRETPAQQGFVSMLDSQLSSSGMSRLVSRSRIPRSCAPVQAENSKAEDPTIYDDADWYALLLRDLVESKMVEGRAGDGNGEGFNGSMPTAASVDALRRQAKTHRANVDVKASKGRKLRYTVQEKIQNFMAPEDRTTWGERQITELFGSLLGKRIAGGLGEAESDDGLDEDVAHEDTNAVSLRLFGR